MNMPPKFTSDANYVWYLGGKDGQRRGYLPDFETLWIDGKDRVLIGPGEVFCRFVGKDGRQCTTTHKYKKWSSLRQHVKDVHKCKVADGRRGHLLGYENRMIIGFYDRLRRIASGGLYALGTPYLDMESMRLRTNAKGLGLDTFDNLANDTQEANTEIDIHEGEVQEASQAA